MVDRAVVDAISKAVSVDVESRAVSVDVESRAVSVDVESRAVSVDVESRAVSLDVESRAVSVDVESRAVSPDVESRAVSVDVESRAVSVDVESRAVSVDVESRAVSLDVESRAVSLDAVSRAVSVDVESRAVSVDVESRAVSLDVESRAVSLDVEPRAVSVDVESRAVSVDVESAVSVDVESRAVSVDVESRAVSVDVESAVSVDVESRAVSLDVESAVSAAAVAVGVEQICRHFKIKFLCLHLQSPSSQISGCDRVVEMSKDKLDNPSNVVELNVGGVFYATTLDTLTRDKDSLFGQMFANDQSGTPQPVKDSKGRYFFDRDGVLFRYVLDYMRNQKAILPDAFQEIERLRQEAEFFRLPGMMKGLVGTNASSPRLLYAPRRPSSTLQPSPDSDGSSAFLLPGCFEGGRESGYVVVGYRGTFAFGREGLADVKFRKLARILVSGRVSICREVFQDTLNESRDPDRGTSDRYSARFYLKHSFIEQAFDMLQEAGFRMVGSCGSGTNSAGEAKPGMDSEENKWNHYNEFVFCRPWRGTPEHRATHVTCHDDEPTVTANFSHILY